MRAANLTIRFACEIAAIVAVVWDGWPWWGIAGGVVLIAVWGAMVAPKASRRLADPQRFIVELVIFAAATFAFVKVGQPVLAAVFAVAAVATAALVRKWPEP